MRLRAPSLRPPLPLMDELCVELAANGWLAWDLEYRTDGGDGGWPETFDDVAAGSTTWPLWTRPGV